MQNHLHVFKSFFFFFTFYTKSIKELYLWIFLSSFFFPISLFSRFVFSSFIFRILSHFKHFHCGKTFRLQFKTLIIKVNKNEEKKKVDVLHGFSYVQWNESVDSEMLLFFFSLLHILLLMRCIVQITQSKIDVGNHIFLLSHDKSPTNKLFRIKAQPMHYYKVSNYYILVEKLCPWPKQMRNFS